MYFGVRAAPTVTIEIARADGAKDCVRSVAGIVLDLRHGDDAVRCSAPCREVVGASAILTS